MLSSGLDTDGGGLTASKVTAVSGPILPINMVDTSTSLPIGVIEAVTPVDNPQVLNAETTSKSICINSSSGSVIQSIRVEMTHTIIAVTNIKNALKTVLLLNLRLTRED